MKKRMMMAETVLETIHMSKIYNPGTLSAYEALHDISLRIEEGEFVAVMGPSGCGKTTLMNAVTTIDMPTGGKVLIKGKDVTHMKENETGRFRSRHLGFVYQNYHLLETHTLFENIAMPLALAGEKDRTIERKVLTLAAKLGIERELDKYPSACSGGQKQRAAIARALANDPSLIAADEPTGNLDSVTALQVMELFYKQNRKEGTTILMVTHDPYIACFTSRVIFLKDGRIVHEIQRGDRRIGEYYREILTASASGRIRSSGR